MRKILKHPILLIALSVLLTTILAIPLKDIVIESSIRQFFPEEDEAYKRLNETEAKFGSMLSIGISLETTEETILTPKNIDLIRKITEELEAVPGTKNVTSITNIDYVIGGKGSIETAPLFTKNDADKKEAEILINEADALEREYEGTTDPSILQQISDKRLLAEEKMKTNETDIWTLQERLSSWDDMYELVVISKDRKGTQISMTVNVTEEDITNPNYGKPTSPNDQQLALDAVRKIVNENLKDYPDIKVKFYGDPVISENSKSYLLSDLIVLIPLVVLVVLISLYFSFSTLDGTILPLITVLMSTIWSIGIMALSGMSFSLVSSVIPVALIGCGSAYGIHVLTHYYIAVDEKRKVLDANTQSFTKEIHLDCIIEGLKNVKIAIVLSAFTTIAGFISLVTSPIRPLFGFAIFTAIGIAFSLLLSVVIIPCFLLLKKTENIGKRSERMARLTEKVKARLAKIEASRVKKAETDETEKPGLANTLYRIYHIFCGTKPRMVIFGIVIVIFSTIGLSKIVIDTSMVNYFPEDAPMRQDINYVNDHFAGTNSIYLLVKSPASLPKAEQEAIENEIGKIREDLLKQYNEKLIALFEDTMQYAGTEGFNSILVKAITSTPDSPEAEPLIAKAKELDAAMVTSTDEDWGGFDEDFADSIYTDTTVSDDDGWGNAALDFDEVDADGELTTLIKDVLAANYDTTAENVAALNAEMSKIAEMRQQANAKREESDKLANMTNPDVLKAIDDMEKWITNNYDVVGKVVSYTDSIKRFNQVQYTPGSPENTSPLNDYYSSLLSKEMTGEEIQRFIDKAYGKSGGKNASVEDFVRTLQSEMNYNGTAFYEIPTDPKKYERETKEELAGIVAEDLRNLGDSMMRFTDDWQNGVPTVARIQVQIKTNSTQVAGQLLEDFEEYAQTHLPEGYFMEATGEGEMEYVMTNLVVSSQLKSLILSLLLVFVILSISFRSPIAGFIGAIPLAFTIILNYMVMGMAGIKLDLITSIIASVAIGVGIDYTIHFMTEYKSLRQNSSNLEQITRDTFKSSGAGIITNAMAVGLGFLVLCFSKFVVLRYIGILIAIVMFTSSMLAMTILPGIFNHFDPKFLHKGKPKAWDEK